MLIDERDNFQEWQVPFVVASSNAKVLSGAGECALALSFLFFPGDSMDEGEFNEL